jgi:glycosyltransferase involved in cell wall biosynthesis
MIQPIRVLRKGKEPHVTVVVPCYNYGHFLPDCVESVISQQGVRTSVHIIDDASVDDSFDVASSLSKLHSNVKATRNASNLGHIATYNRGLLQVESDYVVLLSADDLLAPGSLARATNLMEAHPNVGLVYGHPQTFETEPSETQRPLLHWSVWSGRTWIRAQFRRGLSIIYSPEAVVRTSVQHRAGYYRSDLPHSGDLEMWLRLASLSDVGRVNGPDQAYRRVHPSSMMNTRFKGVLTDLRERQRAYEAYLESPRLGSKDRTGLTATMRKRLSMEALGWAIDELGAGDDDAPFHAAAYAREVNPDYHRLPAWREFEAATRSNTPGIGRQWKQLRRNMGDRLRWQRWRRLGI